MTFDQDIWFNAFMARDPRFDGRFFVAVRTTGVYCRPICPAPKPKRKNCVFMPSAAAAEQAGFRACRRCRPETAPGCAAWRGVETTVARALKLIEEGALDTGSVEELAARLGIGERHLRRLFADHLGASPKAIAQTQRLHQAKRLIETTDLPMTAIAISAGFQSLRRFNDAFRKAFHFPPSDYRKTQETGEDKTAQGDWLEVSLPYRAPFDWNHMLRFLDTRALNGVERVSDGAYRRSIRTLEGAGIISVRAVPGRTRLKADLQIPSLKVLRATIDQMRHAFDLDADSASIDAHLAQDPLFSEATENAPGIRLAGAWDAFEYAARAIIGQQVSVKGARTVASRLAARLGDPLPKKLKTKAPEITHLFPTPAQVAEGDLSDLGMTQTRARTLQGLAQAFMENRLDDLSLMSEKEVMEALTALPGIGPWTAQMIAMKALGHKDAFPATDLGVLKALNLDLSAKGRKALEERSTAWRPWRGYAAMRLWDLLETPS